MYFEYLGSCKKKLQKLALVITKKARVNLLARAVVKGLCIIAQNRNLQEPTIIKLS